MSQPAAPSSRRELPEGVEWANWSGRSNTIQRWSSLDITIKMSLVARFTEVAGSTKFGRFLPKEKFFVDRGIGKAKIRRPRPGLRVWMFRSGDTWYVTHITPKADDHDEQVAVALEAQNEHLRHVKAANEAKKTRRHPDR